MSIIARTEKPLSRYSRNDHGEKLATINRCHTQSSFRKPHLQQEVEQEALLPSHLSNTMDFSERVGPNYFGTLPNQRELPVKPPLHDYLEVDLISRVKNLQSEIEVLKNSLQNSDDSLKLKDSCIYEKIDPKPKKTGRHSTVRSLGSQEACKRGLFWISKICDSNSAKCSRFLCGVILFACIAMTAFHIVDRSLLLYRAPYHISVETVPVPSLSFPSVTICNLNQFKLTEVAEMGAYELVHSSLHRKASFSGSFKPDEKKSMNIKYEDFMHKASHQLSDLVHRCLWTNSQCDLKSFTPVTTEQGICYTFTPKSKSVDVSTSGQMSGLFLVMNIEQYEYILGPMSAVGVAVAFHEPDEQPTEFINIPAGKYTTLELTKNEISTEMPCKGNKQRLCMQSCKDMKVVLHCECSAPPYRDHKSKYRSCTLYDYLTCVRRVRANAVGDCHCSDKMCDRVEFKVTPSYASIPKYGAESEVRSLRNGDQIQEKFRHALDTYHRVDKVIAKYDENTLKSLASGFIKCANVSQQFVVFLNNYIREYRTILDKLRGAFERYNTTIRIHYSSLQVEAHLDFSKFIRSSKNLLEKIQTQLRELSEASDKVHITNRRPDVMWSINQLITTPDKENYSSSHFLDQISEGLKSFRDKLVNSFSGPFKEFQKHHQHYNKITLSMLQHVRTLNSKLLKIYADIKSIGVRPDEDLLQIKQKFRVIYRETSDMLTDKMRNLLRDEQTLRQSYKTNSSKVLSDMNEVEALGRQFSQQFSVFNSNVSNIILTVKISTAILEKLGQKLASIASDYKFNHFSKLEVGVKIDNSGIKTLLENFQKISHQPSEILELMPLDGSSLSKTIRDVVGGLRDFNLLKNSGINLNSDLISNTEINSRTRQVLSSAEQAMLATTSYMAEIDAYSNKRDIDESFYSNNFLYLDIYYKDLKKTVTKQLKTYALLDFFCDVGGVLALYLGASLLTIFDVIDLVGRLTCRSRQT